MTLEPTTHRLSGLRHGPTHRTPGQKHGTESPPLGAGVLTRNQSEIASHLLAASKAVRGTDHQHESQRRDGPNSGMRHQSLYLWNSLGFLLERLAQLVDAGIKLVQQLQQFLQAPSRPRH